MPESMAYESTSNVNAALRESIGSTGASCSLAAIANAMSSEDDNEANGSSPTPDDEDALVISAERVLLSTVEYEEISDYDQTVLETLKSKYDVLTPSPNNSIENRINSPLTCNNNNNNGANGNSAADANGNTSAAATIGNGEATLKKPVTPNELPAPKRILFPRENVLVGWKATGRKWDVGVGMVNVGNTCYLNAILQALFHVPSMANWLMSDSPHMERCESTEAGCIICAMAKTLQASQTSLSHIRPYFVYSKLKSICNHLVVGRQEDAHEFLRFLVEAMEKSYLSRFRNFKELDQYSKETTPLNQILGGYLKSSVKCLSCNYISVKYEHFQDLMLDIRKADTLEEALDGYFSRERLEDFGYNCDECKKKVSANKQCSLERAPIALCIQLKRFSMAGNKINKQISIKPRLDLTKFAVRKNPGEQLTYRLVAMVSHIGASQNCGHYAAFGLTESGKYYNYDDGSVRPVTIQTVCNTSPYIIFYEMDTQPHTESTTPPTSPSSKLNGYVVSSNPQTIIGPQLPPSFSNGNTNALSNGRDKLISSHSATSTSVSPPATSKISGKIMIHYKNNNGTSPNSSASVTSSMAGNSVFENLKNGDSGNENNNYTPNGVHTVATDKFEDSAGAKCSLGVPAAKRQNSNAKNESSSDDDIEIEIVNVSPTKTNNTNSQSATLPSMPRLGADTIMNNNTITGSLSSGISKKPVPTKSLVPYGSESDEELDIVNTKPSSSTADQEKHLVSNPLKRRQNSPPCGSSSDSDAGDDKDSKPTTGNKIKKAACSTISDVSDKTSTKQMLDAATYANGTATKYSEAVDMMFNSKRSTSSTTNNGCVSSPQMNQFNFTSTTPATDFLSTSASNSDSEETTKLCSRPQFKRSRSMPPSPPAVKTNSGMWKVSSLSPSSACEIPAAEKFVPKNLNNPFATKTIPHNTTESGKRLQKESSTNRTLTGNGYEGSGNGTAGDTVVSELLEQSHRGYGAPVLTWGCEQSEIFREIYSDVRQQRQRDWEDDEENEMDRGRQKKIKMPKDPYASNPRTPGYNPFQEQQEMQKHWKRNHHSNGVGRGGYHQGAFRHNFQRNKFKFQKFQMKFPRKNMMNNGSGGGGGILNINRFNDS